MLRPKLEQIPGFLENERYESERTDGRVLSLSLWESEKALIRWRVHAEQHAVQEQARFDVFEDYHLRIGEVVADSDAGELEQSRFDAEEVGAAKAATVTEVDPKEQAPTTPTSSPGLVDAERYRGINTEGKRVLLASWRDDDAAQEWLSRTERPGPHTRRVRIIRDYGMHERREAPQYFPEVPTKTRGVITHGLFGPFVANHGCRHALEPNPEQRSSGCEYLLAGNLRMLIPPTREPVNRRLDPLGEHGVRLAARDAGEELFTAPDRRDHGSHRVRRICLEAAVCAAATCGSLGGSRKSIRHTKGSFSTNS